MKKSLIFALKHPVMERKIIFLPAILFNAYLDRKENRDLLACALRIKLMYESSALHFKSGKDLAKKLDISVNTLKRYKKSPLFDVYFDLDERRGTLVSRCLHRKKKNIRVDKVKGENSTRWDIFFGEVRVMTLEEEDLLRHKRLKSILERLAIMLRINEQNVVNYSKGKKGIKASDKAVPSESKDFHKRHISDNGQTKGGPARPASERGGDENDRLPYLRRGTTINEPGAGGFDSEGKGYLGCAYRTMAAKTGISLTRVKRIIGELDREGAIVRRRRMSTSLSFEEGVPAEVRKRFVDGYMERLNPVRGEFQLRMEDDRGVMRFKSNMYNLGVKGGNTALIDRPKRKNVFRPKNCEPTRFRGVSPDVINDRTVEDSVIRVVRNTGDGAFRNVEEEYVPVEEFAPYSKRKMRREVDFRMKTYSDKYMFALKKVTNYHGFCQAQKDIDRYLGTSRGRKRDAMRIFKAFVKDLLSEHRYIRKRLGLIGSKETGLMDTLPWALNNMSNSSNYQELKSCIGWNGVVLAVMMAVRMGGIKNVNPGNVSQTYRLVARSIKWEPLN